MSSDTCDLLCLDLPHAEAVRAQLAGEARVRMQATQAKALGDPTRLRIASAMSLGDELCVCDLAWITQLSQNLVSHHVRILRTADLATSRRNGRLVMYRLTEAGARLLAAVAGPAQRLDVGHATAEVLT